MTYRQKRGVAAAAFALLAVAGSGAVSRRATAQGAKTGDPTPVGKTIKGGDGATVTLDETRDGQTVPLRVGDTVIVRLASNVTTGYSWKTALLAPVGVVAGVGKPEYINPKVAPGMVGVGGMQVFRFKVLKAGKAKLRLEYRGPGRGADKGPPAQSWGATLAVGAGATK